MKLFRPILIFMALFAPVFVVAEEEPARPRFNAAEIELAEKVVSTLKPEQQLLINGLRYLMTPDYEAEVMGDRPYRPSVLPPFEQIPPDPMTHLEMLRLWAVLQSGMPTTPSMKTHVRRFLDLNVEPRKDNFAFAAIATAVCLEVSRRDDIGHADDAREKAAGIMDRLMDLRDLTGDKSPLVQGRNIDVRWFAAHLWRAVACRAALEMGVKFNTRIWEKDIRELNSAHTGDRGWTSTREDTLDSSHDLNANLIGLAATALIMEAPEDAVGSALRRNVERRLKDIPPLLSRLDRDYPFERTVGGRLLMIQSFAADWSPERLSADVWRGNKLRHAAAYEPTGAVKDFGIIAEDLSLVEDGWKRHELYAAETALSCLAVSGGLYRGGEYALATLTLPEIGRAMHSFSVLHCHRLPPDTDGFGVGPVRGAEDAIRRGCDWLESVQNDDGSFPGQCERYSGNTAIALLAMLHGGWKRDSRPIQKGLEWLLQYDPGRQDRGREVAGVGYHNTYSDAIVLMFLQKYYEPEQRAAGMFLASTPKEFEDARKQVWKAIDAKHRKLIEWSVKNLDGASSERGWGYYPLHIETPKGMAGNMKGYADNSCSQYAMLGYKAASLLGATIDIALLQAEAQRLISDYQPGTGSEVEYVHEPEGKTGSGKPLKIVPGGWGYSGRSSGSIQMTAAGVSSLVIAKDELKVRGELREDLAQKIGLTIHGAQHHMAALYYSPDDRKRPQMDAMFAAAHMDGWSIYYNLYSVERASELAGIDQLGGDVEWYEIGAQALIENQQPDGGWTKLAANAKLESQPQVVNASMAILFLKRASLPVITDPRRRAIEKETHPAPEPEERKGPTTGK